MWVAFQREFSYSHSGYEALRRLGYTFSLNVSGYFLSIAMVPGDSLSAYCSWFCAVMVNRI